MSEDEYHEWARQQGLEEDDEEYIVPPFRDDVLGNTFRRRMRSMTPSRPGPFTSDFFDTPELRGPGHNPSGRAVSDGYGVGETPEPSSPSPLSDEIEDHYHQHSSDASSGNVSRSISALSTHEAPSFIAQQKIFIQRAVDSHSLSSSKDIRAIPSDDLNNPTIQPGCHVIFVGDTIFPPDFPTAYFGDPFIVIRIFGDLWATCARMTIPELSFSATASSTTSSTLSNVSRHHRSSNTSDNRLAGLQFFDFPLCSLTLDQNFNAYCARHNEIDAAGPISEALSSSLSPPYCQLVKPPERWQSHQSRPIDASDLPQWLLDKLLLNWEHTQQDPPYIVSNEPHDFYHIEGRQNHEGNSKNHSALANALYDVDPLGLALPENGPTEPSHEKEDYHIPATESNLNKGSKSVRRALTFSMHLKREPRRSTIRGQEGEAEVADNERSSSLSESKRHQESHRRRSNRSSMSARLKNWFGRGSRANTASSDSSFS